MKVELENLTLGASPLSDEIYLGTLNKNKTMWKSKRNITDIFMHIVIARFLGHEEEVEDGEGLTYFLEPLFDICPCLC